MNTLQLSNTRKWLLVPVFAAFAAYAQVSEAADSFGDTQNQVRAVLEGRLYLDSGRPTAMRAPARVTDVQESTRQILMGSSKSNAGVRLTDSGSTATVRAGHGDGDMLQTDTAGSSWSRWLMRKESSSPACIIFPPLRQSHNKVPLQ